MRNLSSLADAIEQWTKAEIERAAKKVGLTIYPAVPSSLSEDALRQSSIHKAVTNLEGYELIKFGCNYEDVGRRLVSGAIGHILVLAPHCRGFRWRVVPEVDERNDGYVHEAKGYCRFFLGIMDGDVPE
jgi:hypothetical protein